MRRAVILLIALPIVGCSHPEGTETAPPAPPVHAGSGGIAPLGSGAATGMTPMGGTESVDGAGMGGVGQSAKDAARRAAASSSTPGASDDPGN